MCVYIYICACVCVCGVKAKGEACTRPRNMTEKKRRDAERWAPEVLLMHPSQGLFFFFLLADYTDEKKDEWVSQGEGAVHVLNASQNSGYSRSSIQDMVLCGE